MHWEINKKGTVAIAAALLLAGCAQSDTTPQFGDSVRYMTEQQIYDLDAAHNPSPTAVEGGDVDRLNNVLDGHRNRAADPAGASEMMPSTSIRGGSNR